MTDWKLLRAPFPPELIAKVDKGFGPVDTVNHAVVTDRLQNYAPGWTSGIDRVVEVDGKDGMPHVLAIFGWIEIDGIRRHEVGEVERPSTYGDEAKKAMSDLVKRAAMRFGVGTQLWAKEELPEASTSPALSGLVTPGADRQGAASSSPGDVDGGSAPPKDGASAPSGTPTPSDRVPEAAGASRTGSDTSSEPSRAASDTSGGEGRSVDGEDAADPNPSTTRRDQLWANLLDFAGSRKAAVNAVNKACRSSWTEKQVDTIPEDDLEIAIRAYALMEPTS